MHWRVLSLGSITLLICLRPMAAQQVPSLSEDLVMPIVANGEVVGPTHFRTTFSVVNLSQDTLSGEILVYDNDGNIQTDFLWHCKSISLPEPGLVFSIAPGGTFSAEGSINKINGWARIRFAPADVGKVQGGTEVSLVKGQQVGCSNVFNRPSTEILTTARIVALRPAREFRVRTMVTQKRRSAIGIVNPSTTEIATVEVALRRGSEADNLSVLTLPPQRRISRFLAEIVRPQRLPEGEVPNDFQFQGSATIKSNIPIAIGVMDVLLPDGEFVNVPVAVLKQ